MIQKIINFLSLNYTYILIVYSNVMIHPNINYRELLLTKFDQFVFSEKILTFVLTNM